MWDLLSLLFQSGSCGAGWGHVLTNSEVQKEIVSVFVCERLTSTDIKCILYCINIVTGCFSVLKIDSNASHKI